MKSAKDQDRLRDLLRLHYELCELRDLWLALAKELRDDQFESGIPRREDSKTKADALICKVMLHGRN
jgi:hypothetical protein